MVPLWDTFVFPTKNDRRGDNHDGSIATPNWKIMHCTLRGIGQTSLKTKEREREPPVPPFLKKYIILLQQKNNNLRLEANTCGIIGLRATLR